MLIWTRYGIIAPVVWVICLLITQMISDSIFGAGVYTNYILPKIAAGLLSAVTITMIGLALKPKNARELIDARTGERVVLEGEKNTFFFISLEYWGVLFFIITLIIGVIKAFE